MTVQQEIFTIADKELFDSLPEISKDQQKVIDDFVRLMIERIRDEQ